MAIPSRHRSFSKILIIVFGVAFGFIALALSYKGVKEASDIRSRAAIEGDVYKQWSFNATREGWVTPGEHSLSTTNGNLVYTIGNSTNLPFIRNVSVNTPLPTGRKYFAMYVSVTGRTQVYQQPTVMPVPQIADQDTEFTREVTGSGVCTQDVRLCPDGSYVSRTGTSCTFAPCPTMTTVYPTRSPSMYPSSYITPTPSFPVSLYQMKIYYKLAGKPWSKTPLEFSGFLGSGYTRIALPFPDSVPTGGAVRIERLRIVFSNGFKVGDKVRFDWMQLLGPSRSPSISAYPTRYPSVYQTPYPPPPTVSPSSACVRKCDLNGVCTTVCSVQPTGYVPRSP